MEASKGRRIDGAEQGGEQEEEQEQVIEVRKLVSRNASSRAVVPLNSDEEWASICLCLRPWVRSDDVWTALLGMLSGRREVVQESRVDPARERMGDPSQAKQRLIERAAEPKTLPNNNVQRALAIVPPTKAWTE